MGGGEAAGCVWLHQPGLCPWENQPALLMLSVLFYWVVYINLLAQTLAITLQTFLAISFMPVVLLNIFDRDQYGYYLNPNQPQPEWCYQVKIKTSIKSCTLLCHLSHHLHCQWHGLCTSGNTSLGQDFSNGESNAPQTEINFHIWM